MESMIQETRTSTCRACGSANMLSKGTNRCENSHYHYKDSGISRVLKPKQGYAEAEKATVLRLAWSAAADAEVSASSTVHDRRLLAR